MNILHINTERTWRGGEQQTLYLAEGLMRRGHGSVIACQPGKELALRAADRAVEVRPVKMRAEWDLAAVWKLRSIIKSRSIDIVHMHTSHAHTLGVAAARLSRRALTVVARRVDFSIYRHALSLSGVKYRYGVDRYVAISRAIRDVLVKDGISGKRIEVVHSGIDLGRFAGVSGKHLREELGLEPGAPVVGCVAHFAWHKALEYLVDAAPLIAEDIPGSRVVIVGEGSLEEEIKDRAAESGADRHITFTGFRKDVPELLDMFDVFVMPSVMEGLCTSILDALAMRKPVVASQVGGIPEIIEDGVTGLLIPPRDPAALAAAVARVLGDPELARKLAERGRKKVEDAFSTDAMVEGNIGVYERLLAEHGRRVPPPAQPASDKQAKT